MPLYPWHARFQCLVFRRQALCCPQSFPHACRGSCFAAIAACPFGPSGPSGPPCKVFRDQNLRLSFCSLHLKFVTKRCRDKKNAAGGNGSIFLSAKSIICCSRCRGMRRLRWAPSNLRHQSKEDFPSSLSKILSCSWSYLLIFYKIAIAAFCGIFRAVERSIFFPGRWYLCFFYSGKTL